MSHLFFLRAVFSLCLFFTSVVWWLHLLRKKLTDYNTNTILYILYCEAQIKSFTDVFPLQWASRPTPHSSFLLMRLLLIIQRQPLTLTDEDKCNSTSINVSSLGFIPIWNEMLAWKDWKIPFVCFSIAFLPPYMHLSADYLASLFYYFLCVTFHPLPLLSSHLSTKQVSLEDY